MATLEEYEDERISLAAHEDGSSVSSSVSGSHVEEAHHPIVGKTETKAVWLLRLLVMAILVAITVTVSYGVFSYGAQSEQDTYEAQYHAFADKVVSAYTKGSTRRVKALKELSTMYTTYALATNQSFPFVTLNEMETRAWTTLELSEAVAVLYMPVILDTSVQTRFQSKINSSGSMDC